MTTDPATTLGDLYQVQLGPTMPVPIMNGIPNAQVTIANQDLTQSITIGRRNNITLNSPAAVQIPPLGSLTLDASKTIWGLAPTNTLPALVMPGGGQWAPSPAQVAASINALGLAKDASVLGTTAAVTGLPSSGLATDGNLTSVTGPLAKDATLGTPAQTADITGVKNAVNAPIYGPITTANAGLLAKDASVTPLAKDATVAKDTSVVNLQTGIPNNIAATGVPLLRLATAVASGTPNIGAGATITRPSVGFYAMTQIACFININLTCNAGATCPFAIVTLNWTDSASGVLVNTDVFILTMATSPGLQHSIYGQVMADQLQITVQNTDTFQCTLSFNVISNSQVHSLEPHLIVEQQNTGTVPGYNNPSSNLNAGILVNTSPSPPPGTSQTRLWPIYSGTVYSACSEAGVGSGNCIYKLTGTGQGGTSTSMVFEGTSTIAGGNVPFTNTLKLPRCPVLSNYINNGSVNANFQHIVTTVSSN